MLDFYEAVKYVCSRAAELGVDPARIGMAGESGGGYICAGAMVAESEIMCLSYQLNWLASLKYSGPIIESMMAEYN